MKVYSGKTYLVEFFYNKNATLCMITDDNDELVGLGKSVRNPNDKPKKSVGQKNALTRALADMKVDKDTRTTFWYYYLQTYNGLMLEEEREEGAQYLNKVYKLPSKAFTFTTANSPSYLLNSGSL